MPSLEEMHRAEQSDMEHPKMAFGFDAGRRHYLTKLELLQQYLQVLQRDGGLEPLKPVTINLMEEVVRKRLVNPVEFKQTNYRLVDDERFEVV